MKLIIFVVSIFGLFSFCKLPGAYDYTFQLPDGSQQSLSQYAGKRIMIVVLPSTQTSTDSSLLISLDSLSREYTDSITMIGIPSYEDGFLDDSLEILTSWYRGLLGNQFIVAAGMSTRKTSAYQADLFSWLTHADQNGHFDDDVMGAGEKFFITTEGDLYAICSPQADWNEDILKQMLAKNEYVNQ